VLAATGAAFAKTAFTDRKEVHKEVPVRLDQLIHLHIFKKRELARQNVEGFPDLFLIQKAPLQNLLLFLFIPIN
jgi:hypothetical protein